MRLHTISYKYIKPAFLTKFRRHVQFDKSATSGKGFRAKISFLPYNREGAFRDAGREMLGTLAFLYGEQHHGWKKQDKKPFLSAASIEISVIEDFFTNFKSLECVYSPPVARLGKPADESRAVAPNRTTTVSQMKGDRPTTASLVKRLARSIIPILGATGILGLNLSQEKPSSNIRGSVSPFEFCFLEHDVTEFVLNGAAFPQSQHPTTSIFATSQSASCLANMLRRRALVFGDGRNDVRIPMDVVASPAEVLSLWAPAQELEVVKYHGDDGTVNQSLKSFDIGGGQIKPCRTGSKASPPMWHWEAYSNCEAPLSKPSTDSQADQDTCVDLSTRIRIGASQNPTTGMGAAGPGSASGTGHGAGFKLVLEPQVAHVRHQMQPPPGRTFSSNAPASLNHDCAYDNEEFDRDRRQRLDLKDVGTAEGFSQYVGTQFTGVWEVVPGRPIKDTLLQKKDRDLLVELDTMCGLFVSMCTKVMVRVRLRDLVTQVGSILDREKFPTIPQKTAEESATEIVSVLQGSDNVLHWLQNACARRDTEQETTLESKMHKFNKLTFAVFQRLKHTGVLANEQFDAAWVSPGEPVRVLRTAPSGWLQVLKPNCDIATFACITSMCLETADRKCGTGRRWEPREGFGNFVLATRVALYEISDSSGSHDLSKRELKVGKSFWVNSKRSTLKATVLSAPRGQNRTVYLEIKDVGLVGKLRKIFPQILIIKEVKEARMEGARKCVISGLD
ncbi:hypothetical protein B0T10DRAFT_458356 [Thelonectria olida]|uniref:Uncharacterized protein n=1 Tax=Thelonectria olida TaxID=1576542 RepID=A0A9P9AUI3_9HYPO|nr:hypothetical protein B0T10DRAFT_458356 [Thelonectria olida]